MDIEQNSVGIVPVESHEDAVPPVFRRESGVDWRGQRDRLDEAVRSWLATTIKVSCYLPLEGAFSTLCDLWADIHDVHGGAS